jgi:hypothetical protein
MLQSKLTNPNGAANRARLSFSVSREADDVLPKFQIEWNRKDLQPNIISAAVPSDETDPTDIRHTE